MIQVTARSSILLAVNPIDFRKQADGLIAHCQQTLRQNPKSGTFFVFINKAHTMIRILVFDTNGFWVCTKRLSQGKYKHWPRTSQPLSTLKATELMGLLRNHLGPTDFKKHNKTSL